MKHMMTARNPKRLVQLAWMAILGQAVLLASAWLLPAVSDSSLIRDHVSELALGRFGFVQTAAFLVAGLGTISLAVAIRRVTAGARGSLAGSVLVGVYGVGAILSAIFPTDRVNGPPDLTSMSAGGLIHIAVSFVSFIGVTVAMFILTWTFMRRAGRQLSTWWWIFFPAAALSLLIVQAEGPWVGLLQRVLVTVISAWLVLVALRIRSIVGAAEPSVPAPAHRQPVPTSNHGGNG
jgi:hypothetical protein